MPLTVGTLEGVVGAEHAVVGTHGHLPAQHLFGLVIAHGDTVTLPPTLSTIWIASSTA
jgi:hypothetical protein